jgi:hypothetical protein
MKALNAAAESADELSWRINIRPASAAVLRCQAASAAMIFLARDQCHSTHAVQHPRIRHHDKASASGRDTSKYTERGSIPIFNKRCAVIPEGTNCDCQSRVAKNDTDLPTHTAKSGMFRSRPKRFTIAGDMFRVSLGL